MPKTTKTATKKSTTTPVPPMASAIAALIDPHSIEVGDFREAYARMPELLAHIQNGKDDQRWTLIRELSGLSAAELRAKRPTGPASLSDGNVKRMAYAVDTLNREDVDLVTDFLTPI